MTTVQIAGIEFDLETVRTLEAAGGAHPEVVLEDIERVRRGEAADVLSECLDGAEGENESCWRDYVATLEAHVG